MVWIGSRNKIIRKRPGKEKPKITEKKKKRKYSRGQNRPKEDRDKRRNTEGRELNGES
jgi:hypothetical protein